MQKKKRVKIDCIVLDKNLTFERTLVIKCPYISET